MPRDHLQYLTDDKAAHDYTQSRIINYLELQRQLNGRQATLVYSQGQMVFIVQIYACLIRVFPDYIKISDIESGAEYRANGPENLGAFLLSRYW